MHVLGLPGNPVSAFVCALLFLVPLIRRLAGRSRYRSRDRIGACSAATCRKTTSARIICAPRSRRDRTALWSRRPFPIQDSSMMAALAKADCLVVREPFAPAATAGSRCAILRLTRPF